MRRQPAYPPATKSQPSRNRDTAVFHRWSEGDTNLRKVKHHLQKNQMPRWLRSFRNQANLFWTSGILVTEPPKPSTMLSTVCHPSGTVWSSWRRKDVHNTADRHEAYVERIRNSSDHIWSIGGTAGRPLVNAHALRSDLWPGPDSGRARGPPGNDDARKRMPTPNSHMEISQNDACRK